MASGLSIIGGSASGLATALIGVLLSSEAGVTLSNFEFVSTGTGGNFSGGTGT